MEESNNLDWLDQQDEKEASMKQDMSLDKFGFALPLHEPKPNTISKIIFPIKDSAILKEALSINALRACVYIYIRQLSSFRAPTL